MWNSFRTDAGSAITAEVITYPGGNGDEIHAYIARPAADEPVPGIVAVHHLPGWDEFYREFAERLARHGYSVICPDLYCRFGHGTPDDGKAYEFHRYDGASHAFFYYHTPMYRPEAAMDGWAKIFSFFSRQLSS